MTTWYDVAPKAIAVIPAGPVPAKAGSGNPWVFAAHACPDSGHAPGETCRSAKEWSCACADTAFLPLSRLSRS